MRWWGQWSWQNRINERDCGDNISDVLITAHCPALKKKTSLDMARPDDDEMQENHQIAAASDNVSLRSYYAIGVPFGIVFRSCGEQGTLPCGEERIMA